MTALTGTPAQIKWAENIRLAAFTSGFGTLNSEQKERLAKVNDSTWWIANRDKSGETGIISDYKEPMDYQMEGGPPKPLTVKQPKPAEFKEPAPHDAELFAASVCKHPALAEIALLALLARCYKNAVGARLKQRAEARVEEVRAELITAIDRDIDGIRRILNSKS